MRAGGYTLCHWYLTVSVDHWRSSCCVSDMMRWGQYMPPSGAQPFSTASANETATPPTSVTETKEAMNKNERITRMNRKWNLNLFFFF